MDFRRSAQGDGRRRRVLIDELHASADGETEAGHPTTGRKSRATNTKRYRDSALPEHQPRISCILPMSGWTVSFLAISGLLVIAGIELLYWKLHPQSLGQPEYFSTFDVTLPNSFAAWFSSVFLFSAAVIASVVFAIRRHKLDDYRGRYRLWLWNAVTLLIASVDSITGLRHAIPQAVEMFAKNNLVQNPNVWWIGMYGLLVGLGSFRLWIEMWSSRLARFFLTLSLAGLVATAAMILGWSPIEDAHLAAVTRSATGLVSQWLLLLTLMSYGRFVHLDAQGLAQRRKAKPAAKTARTKTTKAATGGSSSNGEETSTAPEVKSAPAASTMVRIDSAHLSSPKASEGDDGAEDARGHAREPHYDSANRKMSKAERRRLRQQ